MFWSVVVIAAWLSISVILTPVLGLFLKRADETAIRLDPRFVVPAPARPLRAMRRAS